MHSVYADFFVAPIESPINFRVR